MPVTGQTGVVESASRYQRDANGFDTTIREWMGLEEDLRSLGDTLDVPWEISQVSGPVFRLSATYAGRVVSGSLTTSPEAQVVTVWSLKVQQRRADLWEHPKVRAELEKITDLQGRGKFLADLRALAAGEVVTYTSDTSGVTTAVQLTLTAALAAVASAGVDSEVINQFVAELSRGVDGYNFDTFVLTKKRVGPTAATTLLPSFALANIPVTTAALLAAESSIPTAIRSAIQSELSAWYWLRNGDELNQIDRDRIEVNSQWVAGKSFSTFVYGE